MAMKVKELISLLNAMPIGVDAVVSQVYSRHYADESAKVEELRKVAQDRAREWLKERNLFGTALHGHGALPRVLAAYAASETAALRAENERLQASVARWSQLAQEAGCTECSPTYQELQAELAQMREAPRTGAE
jgi:hypothetical protein